MIYDGIHYDPLVLVGPTGDQLQTTFPMDNDAVLVEGLEIAKEAFKVIKNIYIQCIYLF